jgi:hypothetical protein
MRKPVVLAAILTAVAAIAGVGVGAQAALAAEPVIHRESLAGLTIHNDCTNEDVAITDGDIQFVLVEHGNENRAIETFHVGTSGVTGTGTTTGSTYRYAEASIGQYNQGFDGTTENIAVAHVTLVGTGGAGASTTTLIVVWRLDADGLHVNTEQSRITCNV